MVLARVFAIHPDLALDLCFPTQGKFACQSQGSDVGARSIWSDFLCLSCNSLILRSRSCKSAWHENCERRVHLFPSGQDPAHCLHQEELQRSVSGDRIQQQEARQAVLREYSRTESYGRLDSVLAIKRFLRRHDAIETKQSTTRLRDGRHFLDAGLFHLAFPATVQFAFISVGALESISHFGRINCFAN